jgi:hypothetical protein
VINLKTATTLLGGQDANRPSADGGYPCCTTPASAGQKPTGFDNHRLVDDWTSQRISISSSRLANSFVFLQSV